MQKKGKKKNTSLQSKNENIKKLLCESSNVQANSGSTLRRAGDKTT